MKSKRILSLVLSIMIMLGAVTVSAFAENENISVTVKFDASVVAADMDTLYSDLKTANIIAEDITNLPLDITVTVPKGSTVKDVLSAAQAEAGFTAVGIDSNYVERIGYVGIDEVGAEILKNLVSISVGDYYSGNIFYCAGWSFYIDGEGLLYGIDAVTVTNDGAILEGRFNLAVGLDSDWNAVRYDEIFLASYKKLKELTETDVDTSTFTEKQLQKLTAEKAEAEALLAEIYNEAALNEAVSATLLELHPGFKTSGGMWIGYIEKKGTSFWGTGSSSEKLQIAVKELEAAISPLPENLLSELYVMNLFGVTTETSNNLIIDFSSDKYEYVIKDYTKDNFLAEFMKWKSVAASDDATVSVSLNGESVSPSDLNDNWKQYSNLNWTDKVLNTLTFTVTPPEESTLEPTVYTVKIYSGIPEPENIPLEKEERDELISTLLENIAETYTEKSSYWEVMDMGAYKKLMPETEAVLSDDVSRAFINTAIKTVVENNTDTELAKAILALTAYGKDATRLYTVNSNTPVDAIKRLSGTEHSTSVWSAPYTLAAYNRAEYKNRDKELSLVNALLESQENGAWDEYGTIDTTANAIAGLAFYQNDEDSTVKGKVNEAIEAALAYLSTQQNADGSFSDSWSGRNSNSTAMVAIALSAAGVDVENDERFIKNGNCIIDGLLSFALEDNSGFGHTDNVAASDKSTEQAFRALIALAGAIKTDAAYNVYDFNGITLSPARATGEYTGGNTPSAPQGKNVSVTLTIKADSGYWLNGYTVTLQGDGATVYHAFVKGCGENNIRHEGADNGYVSSISKGNKTLAEFGMGENSGWLYKLNGEAPLLGIRECNIKNGDSILFFYTQDYTKEPGIGGGLAASGTKEKAEQKLEEEKEPATQLSKTYFADVPDNAWYKNAVEFAVENNLFNGVSEKEFAPSASMTRAMLVTVLYRMANPENNESNHSFSDVAEGQWYSDAVAWAAANGVVSGINKSEFAPDTDITREQMALIIYRFAKMQNYDLNDKADVSAFDDKEDISNWAYEAMCWANKAGLITGTSKTTLSPSATATRAEVATILMRFCEKYVK